MEEKHTGYGAEANIKYAVLKGLQFFGNYAYIHARFAENDVDGSEQEYAGNMFRLTPEHSFALGLNARIEIAKEIVFVWYSFLFLQNKNIF